jgi:two-component system, OmpR family, phosphate regulon response regulator PhoB
MSPTDTLYLTSATPPLLRDLRAQMPQAAVAIIGDDIPVTSVNGSLWCFVDWLLPEISGLELCRRLREHPATREAHITMILEADDPDARRRALRAGADDYLVGPVDVAKLARRLHRPSTVHLPPAQKLQHGALEIDPAAFLARYRGQRIGLAPNEFRLLAHFVENPDRVFTRNSLIGMVGKDNGVIDDRTVDVWIGRLRRALKEQGVPDPLRTVRSVGYVFDGVEAGVAAH